VSDYQNLLAWKLASELRDVVLELTSHGRAAKDLKFRTQTEDAVSSVCRNLPEGFSRFKPGEFATFVRYSQASLAELGEQLNDGVARKYWTDDQVEPARRLTRRTGGALGALRRYLTSEQARRNAKGIAERTRTQETSRREGDKRTRVTKGTQGTHGTPGPQDHQEPQEPQEP
jgi:four helix bundle protein